VRTPAKAPLVLPTREMALAIAAEWDAQAGEIRPATMPMARYAHSAIDKVTPQRAEVAEIVAAYGASDLLCYRAIRPDELYQRQAEAWDPILDWAAGEFGARLLVTRGVMPAEQPAAALASMRAAVLALDPFRLAAFHDLVALTGSLVLGFAVARGRLSADESFSLSRIDEDWQIAEWGEDDEAAAAAVARRAALDSAATFFRYCG
jgi:chaperone required for assembly of F1-ATPase